jgi:hypothetical protein
MQALGALVSACAVIAVLGCGDDGLGKRYPVSGTVKYKGTPLDVGTITFYPTSGPNQEVRGASGAIKGGSYTLSTAGTDDGAFPGDYAVAISARAPDMSLAKANQEKVGGSMRQDDVAKAYAKASSAIPKRFENTATSKLTAKVEAHSNTFDFDLKDD